MDALVRYGLYLQKKGVMDGYVNTFIQNRKKKYCITK
jgi:hypothetical protein